ncbi:hypothetical protein EB796_011980 [Bugula neritina]|uniref:Uncharacterized protein n=1 Tax=Bugula neritina TaxID=10212 RepID=A0A7J7JWJ5_BUGNE|nr:hypothetical protein EB796_011980 [Bugula neritina]
MSFLRILGGQHCGHLHAGVLTNTSLVGSQRAKSLTPWMFKDNQCVYRKHDALEIFTGALKWYMVGSYWSFLFYIISLQNIFLIIYTINKLFKFCFYCSQIQEDWIKGICMKHVFLLLQNYFWL